MRKLVANTISGVYEVENDGLQTASESVFYAMLKDLSDDDMISSIVSDEMYDKIDAEYGIH